MGNPTFDLWPTDKVLPRRNLTEYEPLTSRSQYANQPIRNPCGLGCKLKKGEVTGKTQVVSLGFPGNCVSRAAAMW